MCPRRPTYSSPIRNFFPLTTQQITLDSLRISSSAEPIRLTVFDTAEALTAVDCLDVTGPPTCPPRRIPQMNQDNTQASLLPSLRSTRRRFDVTTAGAQHIVRIEKDPSPYTPPPECKYAMLICNYAKHSLKYPFMHLWIFFVKDCDCFDVQARFPAEGKCSRPHPTERQASYVHPT